MMKRSLLPLSLCALLLVAACQAAPVEPDYTIPRYGHLPKLTIPAIRLEIHSSGRGDDRSVVRDAPVAIADAAYQWVEDRIAVTGGSGEVVFFIKYANIYRHPLEIDGGIKGALKREQAEQYDGILRMEVTWNKPGLDKPVTANAHVRKTATLSEDATPAERDALLHSMVKDMMDRLNALMQKELMLRMVQPESIDRLRD